MDLGLQGKTALVTGSGGGLGRAIAIALAREGARVALADIDAGALDELLGAVRAAGGDGLALVWDLADLALVDDRVGTVERGLGPVDVLVSITGGPPPTPASGQASASWAAQFLLMVAPVIAIADRILPGMRTRKWGRIITSTSSGVIAPIPNLGMSNALRLALVGWSKTLAREIAKDGVTANIVVPGRIATQRIRFLDEAKAKREGRPLDGVVAESVATIPAGRYGDPSEYADVVAFLAGTPSSYVTGSIVRVDGGMIPSI